MKYDWKVTAKKAVFVFGRAAIYAGVIALVSGLTPQDYASLGLPVAVAVALDAAVKNCVKNWGREE